MKSNVYYIDGLDEAPLKEVQELLGGYVEMLPTTLNMIGIEGDCQMLVNEEGLIHELPHNPVASLLAAQRIVGNLVVLSGKAKWK
jgi:hypothetical protein